MLPRTISAMCVAVYTTSANVTAAYGICMRKPSLNTRPRSSSIGLDIRPVPEGDERERPMPKNVPSAQSTRWCGVPVSLKTQVRQTPTATAISSATSRIHRNARKFVEALDRRDGETVVAEDEPLAERLPGFLRARKLQEGATPEEDDDDEDRDVAKELDIAGRELPDEPVRREPGDADEVPRISASGNTDEDDANRVAEAGGDRLFDGVGRFEAVVGDRDLAGLVEEVEVELQSDVVGRGPEVRPQIGADGDSASAAIWAAMPMAPDVAPERTLVDRRVVAARSTKSLTMS